MTTKIIVALAVDRCARRVRQPRRLEADFGNSVDSLIKAQTANPATLTSPSMAAVTGVDPDYANNVVDRDAQGRLEARGGQASRSRWC